MRAALRGCDAVIHLAASSAVQTPWEDALNNNIVGQYTVLEAMRQEGVPRIVFATTNHVTGYYELKGRPCSRTCPCALMATTVHPRRSVRRSPACTWMSMAWQ